MQDPNQAALIEQLELERRFQSGARWFYWIGALSLINSTINMTGGQINFVIGLTATQFIDGFAMTFAKTEGATLVNAIALCINFLVAGVFFMFGAFAMKRQLWAFILGMVCYGVDALLSLLVFDPLTIGFHAFALWCIFGGFKAGKVLQTMQAPAPAPEAPAA